MEPHAFRVSCACPVPLKKIARLTKEKTNFGFMSHLGLKILRTNQKQLRHVFGPLPASSPRRAALFANCFTCKSNATHTRRGSQFFRRQQPCFGSTFPPHFFV